MNSEPAATLPIAPGDVIAGKYRVDRVLGRGGMGVVVEALHLDLDQRVALKFIVPGAVGDDAQAIERFLREARAAVRLKSEHVAKVLDVGKLPSGSPYIVMEYLEGQDLGAVVELEGPLSAERAADYVLQACEALAEAHAVGIVHRDVKPQNLFLSRGVGGTAVVKVLDFGVSKVRGPGGVDSALTRTSSVMGSPMYMAPEQMRSARAADARSDIWALGVVLYTLLTGAPPFDAETMTELALKVVQDPHPPISLRRPGVAPGLCAIVDRCLSKDPASRYADVSDLAIALSEFAPPASRVLAENTRAILRRMSDAPPPRTSSSSDDRTMRSVGATLALGKTVSGAWWHVPEARRARGAVGAIVAGVALATVLFFGFGRSKPTAETQPMTVAAPAARPAPAAPVVPAATTASTSAPAATAAAAPSTPDAASPAAITSAPAPRGDRPSAVLPVVGPTPPKAGTTGATPRKPAPGASASTRDDEIPALR